MHGALLRIEEVSARTGIPPATLRYWRHLGTELGAMSFRLGRRVVWDQADVDAWIAAKREEGSTCGTA